MEPHGKNLIGLSSSGEGSTTFKSYAPATGVEMDPVFHGATAAEVDRAVSLAADAFPIYRKWSGDSRASFLEAIADEIEAIGDRLLERCDAETGLGIPRLTGERGRTTGQLRLFASLVREGSWVDARIDRAIPDREPLPKPDARLMLMPIGPVVVFGASNFPLAFSTAGGDTASALAAGCPVIVKAHRSHAGTGELVGQAIQRAAKRCDAPDGVFSLIHGAGAQVGTALVEHPQIKAVGFTGSLAGGRALFDLASRRPEPIPVYAEMGSLNPVFVLPGAMAEGGPEFAEGLRGSVTLGVGQFCTNPGLVLGIDGEEMDGFIEATESLFEEAPTATMLNPGIRDAYEKGLVTMEGASNVSLVAKSSQSPDAGRTEASPHVWVTDVASYLENPSLSHEVFGPTSLIVRCKSKQEMIDVANRLDGHLTSTLHGTEGDLVEHVDLVEVLERKTGRLIFNGFPTGVEVCHSMHHGGPYPATTDARSTSVGTSAIFRFTRLVCYQSFPNSALPEELKNENPLGLWRTIDGEMTQDPV
ncbi:MAG: aldehyde dehydrogenase (NADP(+)) [Gemmatimonadetes bacterium]|nr:aldehyde dehydrogenase (NADP(+)) [Gemmatimonadota bacterium]